MKRKLDKNDAPTIEVPPGDAQNTDHHVASFDGFQLDPRLVQAIAKAQFTTPTPVQAQTIPLALKGKDVLAKSQTGTGKTAAYVLPCIQAVLHRKAQNSKNKATAVLVLVPTRELSDQVTRVFASLGEFCGKSVGALNLTQKVGEAVIASKLNELPDVVVSTPGKAAQLLGSGTLSLKGIQMLVIDEADLVLSYGYEHDLQAIRQALPTRIQSFLISATLTPEVDQLKSQFCHDPAIVKIEDEKESAKEITQFVVKCAEDEKFLLIFVIFKLKLVKGKTIVFVSDLERSYRLKLFLEQFGIRSCILNSELPVNSRLHAVQEFNKGFYDILIAADDQEVIGGIQTKAKSTSDTQADSEAEDDQDGDQDQVQPRKKKTQDQKDYGISRGIDFQNVSCVLNFDLPSSSKSYTHRIGRTARAGKSGMALSFVIPSEHFGKHKSTSTSSARHDEKVLGKIKTRQAKKGKEIKDYNFDMAQVEGFRYRVNDALKAVSHGAIREARTREIKQELLKSEKLKKHFEDNPDDLQALRNGSSSSAGLLRTHGHMKHVPDYLLPGGKRQKPNDNVGFVSFNGDRKKDRDGKRRGGGRGGKRGANRRLDPLKAFKSKRK